GAIAGRPVIGSITVDPATFAPACAGLPLVTASTGGSANPVIFTDGRINSHASDAAQTAAIYCESDGGVTIWAVKNSVGTFAYTVTGAQIKVVPAKPAKNTLIKKAFDIALYRLTSGELQVNAPNGYLFRWAGC